MVVFVVVRQMSRFPLVTGIMTYTVTWGSASLLQQKVISKHDKIDWAQTGRVTFIGGALFAPLIYSWMRVINFMNPWTTFVGCLQKALVEQLIMAPFCHCLFFGTMTVLEGRKQDVAQEIVVKVPQTWKVGCCIWPIVQTVNFLYVPLHFRTHTTALFSFCWSTFLCYMKDKKTPKTAQVTKVKEESVK